MPRPIHLGEILKKQFLLPLNITQYRLAKEIHMQQAAVSEIIRGKRSISADMALRLSAYFSNSPEFWLNLQNRYELDMVKIKRAGIIAKIHAHAA